MNRIRNNIIVPLKNQINIYNMSICPIVCQYFADSHLVISSNFEQMINNGNVTFGRRMRYYAYFAIHLLVMIKYAILATHDDPYTIALLGETLHVLTNNYLFSIHCFTMQMAIVPAKLTIRYYGDHYFANMLVNISRLDTSLAFSRINNRKLTTEIWLKSKLFNKLMFPIKWIVISAAMLYCSILAYTNSPIPINLVSLTFNSIIQCLWMINVTEICFCAGICFFLTLSMAQLRYKELIYMVKVKKVAGLIKVSHLYNQLVIDIEVCRRLFDPIIGIIYLTLPFPIGFLIQVILDGNWMARVLAVIAVLLGCSTNFSMYYMVSSICPMNKKIVKLLIPIQFEKRPKTRQMKLKIDSLIARLNEEFVGFYCLYAMKFTRKSFYQYIIGISTTYFLVSGLINARQV